MKNFICNLGFPAGLFLLFVNVGVAFGLLLFVAAVDKFWSAP